MEISEKTYNYWKKYGEMNLYNINLSKQYLILECASFKGTKSYCIRQSGWELEKSTLTKKIEHVYVVVI